MEVCGPEVERPREMCLGGHEARKLATEGAKKPAHDIRQRHPKPGVDAQPEASRRLPKKCGFAEMLGCVGSHPPWKCRPFSDIAPKEREWIIKDSNICLFCFSTRWRMSATPRCPRCRRSPEDEMGKHIQWLLGILISKSIVNAKALELLDEGAMNMVAENGW
jgi:hypothetical protein